MRKRILLMGALGFVAFCLFSDPGKAQVQSGIAVTSCGGRSLTAGQAFPLALDLTGNLCSSGSGGSGGAITSPLGPTTPDGSAVAVVPSATANFGGFAPNGNYASLTATNTSASVSLPTGTSVVVTNNGSAAVSCSLGTGSATAVTNQNVIQPSQSVTILPNSFNFIACINQTGSSSNVVSIAGGSGTYAGVGGFGVGAGGGGAVTIANGANVVEGNTGDSAGASTIIGQLKQLTAAILSAGQAAMSASAPVAIASDQSAVAVGARQGGSTVAKIACTATAFYDGSTSGETQIVALASSQTIYVCGYSILLSSGTTNVNLAYGTGTNCASGTTKMTPAYQFVPGGSTVGIVDGSPEYRGLKTAASNALCVNVSAANAVQVIVYYAQF